MSQYGANYMAAAGSSAAQILKHFYGPARITTVREPGEIRVLAADGLNRALVKIEGPVKVTTETGSILATGNLFSVTGGKQLSVQRGVGPSLQPVLQITSTATAFMVNPGESVTIPFSNSRSARVSIEIADSQGVVFTTPEVSYVSGENSVIVPLRDAQSKDLPGGLYKATVVGFDGLDHVRSVSIAITIAAPTLPAVAAPTSSKGHSSAVSIGVLIGVSTLLLLSGLAWRRRTSNRT
jgi:hypothetical protein